VNVDVVIDRRFIGPPSSGNGGYVCGVTATALTDGPAETTLRRPPPIDRPLRLDVSPERAVLLDGDDVVAEAVHADRDLGIEMPDPVSLAEAREAAERFEVDDYHSKHPFPGCFTCGPGRSEGDGLRIFPAELDRSVPTVAWPWTPAPSLAGDDGLMPAPVVWAALDCPSGLARARDQHEGDLSVLGRMATVIERRPAPGEELVAAGWVVSRDGRKRLAASAVWSRDGEVMARCRATWVALTDEQARAFGAMA